LFQHLNEDLEGSIQNHTQIQVKIDAAIVNKVAPMLHAYSLSEAP